MRGAVVDDQTRCVHYASELDVVAIRFRCCDTYYPCHACHAEAVDHPAERWTADERAAQAILCGVCGHELRVLDYLAVDACPACGAGFNPGCRAHAPLYFEVDRTVGT